MGKSIWSRKLDLLYLVFFFTHIPILLFVDLTPWYPEALRPEFNVRLRKWYIDTYRDQFFITPPVWFHLFAFLELIYHLPFSLWAVGALIKDDPQIPLQILIFGLETFLTTLTCMVEVFYWEGYTTEELNQLIGLYLPYLALAAIMSFDMFLRLRSIVQEHTKLVGDKKRS